VSTQANPLAPVSVASGNYTMSATNPTGFLLVSCGGSATVSGTGLTASQSVTSPPGGAGVGVFYASAPTSAGGGGNSGPGGTTGSTPIAGATSSSGSGVPTTPALAAAGPVAVAAATPTSGAELAFTGMSVLPPLLVGLVMISLGTLMVVGSGRRRRFQIQAAVDAPLR